MKSNSPRTTTAQSTGCSAPGQYVCPACRIPVLAREDHYACDGCELRFPILFGIVDFRLASDQYLDLEAERLKAGHLFEFAQSATFSETLSEYYRITEDVPRSQATRFKSYANRGVDRGELICDALGAHATEDILDVGCGTGGFLVAAIRRGYRPVGVDIAMRWLVLCALRLRDLDLVAELVCADVAALPFADGRFSSCVLADLVEHIADDAAIARAVEPLVAPGGRLFLSSANRFALTAYPSAGLWAVGYLPKSIRGFYIRFRRGIDTMRFSTPRSAAHVRRILEAAGLTVTQTSPLNIPVSANDASGLMRRLLMKLYRLMRQAPIVRSLFVHFGPAFEMLAERRTPT